MVFDVESVGLHGEGFAIGFVVVNSLGTELDHGLYSCHREICSEGVPGDIQWVVKNVPQMLPNLAIPESVRSIFWEAWLAWKEKGATLWADCLWPVEARFLLNCVNDNKSDRNWQGPYPFHEIATALLCHGKDPLAKFPRLENEMPEHNPLCDSRQSARILIETLHPKGSK